MVKLFGAASPRVASFDHKGTAITGDVHPEVGEVAGALTPVPGGGGTSDDRDAPQEHADGGYVPPLTAAHTSATCRSVSAIVPSVLIT